MSELVRPVDVVRTIGACHRAETIQLPQILFQGNHGSPQREHGILLIAYGRFFFTQCFLVAQSVGWLFMQPRLGDPLSKVKLCDGAGAAVTLICPSANRANCIFSRTTLASMALPRYSFARYRRNTSTPNLQVYHAPFSSSPPVRGKLGAGSWA